MELAVAAATWQIEAQSDSVFSNEISLKLVADE